MSTVSFWIRENVITSSMLTKPKFPLYVYVPDIRQSSNITTEYSISGVPNQWAGGNLLLGRKSWPTVKAEGSQI